MRRKSLALLAVCVVMISILIGGCSDMKSKAVTTNGKYPEKPITIIVPFSAGGAMDLVARAMEKEAPKYLGQPLAIVIKPGGGWTIAWNELAGASPDGYTLGMTGIEILLQPLYGQAKYNYSTALEPIAHISELPMVLAIQSEQPWQDIADLVRYAKQHPGQIKFGAGGVGTIGHIIGETFANNAGIHMELVPFRGASEGTIALLGGHVQVLVANTVVVKEHVKNGTVRVLAVSAEQRLNDPVFAQIPTFKEQGLNVVYDNWFGVGAPKELPVEVKTKLSEGLKAMFADPEFQENVKSIGLQVNYLGPKESEAKWLSDSQQLSKAIQESGILDLIKAQKK